MKTAQNIPVPHKRASAKAAILVLTVIVCFLAISVMLGGCYPAHVPEPTESTAPPVVTEPTEPPTTEPTEPPLQWETGFLAALGLEITYCDEAGVPTGTLPRGAQVEYATTPDGRTAIQLDDSLVYLQEDACIVSDPANVVSVHTLYVRTTVNLRDVDGNLLAPLAEKGQAVEVTGCDYVYEDGSAHMYRVNFGGEEGYIMPWYLADNEADALANYDNGSYATHESRGDRYGGGIAANLDYFPREKGPIEGNVMPDECRTLYLVNWRISNVDEYLALAEGSGINAFVVDIVDGGSVGYAAEVMTKYSPTAASAANNTVEEYQAAIQKIKDAGYYVIGRITTFNDTYFIKDHPEYAITDLSGTPLKMNTVYWPTPYNRISWQYKVDLAVEAVELMGFNEIQFDYVRFPDVAWRYEEAGIIDYHNAYDETKAQVIQRFLMYATDIIHEHGAYVSADVYGESAYNYVTAYGQYWPAISNVVDVISGMPYPDHFSASGDWLPWEHPYDTLYNWGRNVMYRQDETTTPAAVRTWIQAYNAIREPYNFYGPNEVSAQIKGLRDAGCTGGYMTWNPLSSIEKYQRLIPAFAPPEETQAVQPES